MTAIAQGTTVSKNSRKTWASLLLILVTFVWGFTFVTTQQVLAKLSAIDFIAWRFGIAALVMVAIKPKAIWQLPKKHKLHGIFLGLALGTGYLFQCLGLIRTSATASGFITGLFVVLTPILAGFILKEPIEKTAWLAVLVTTVGLGFLALKGWSIGFGELLTLACALFFSLHIVGLDKWSKPDFVYGLTAMQIITVFVMYLISGLALGGIKTPPDTSVFVAIIFMAVVGTCLGYFAQTWVQSLIGPTKTAIILTTEPVFAGIAGVTIGSDILTWKMIVGGVLILAGTYVVELGPRHSAEGTHPHLEP